LGEHRARLDDEDLVSGLKPPRATALADALQPVIIALQQLQARLREVGALAPEPVSKPVAPARKSKPPRPTRSIPPKPKRRTAAASKSSSEARLLANAMDCYRLMRDLARRVGPADLAEAIARKAKISQDLAARIALLNDLPERWKSRLESSPEAAATLTLAELLRSAGLEAQDR
jgi:hypothetical protein